MARYRGPIAKISRRLNIALTEKAQKVLNKRPFPPGQHGPSARRRQMSDYGMQLQEKQKARYMYGVLEKQFRNLYARAQRVPGETGAALFMLLERRLDNVVYRMGLATTRQQARQLVAHGHVTVNGRKTNIPSFTVRVGEKIAVRVESRKRTYFKTILEAKELLHRAPEWMRVVHADLSAEIVALPRREDAEQGINEQLIVEFYSR
ncbi:MAG: 30S ribosomal protein S4 [Roseiflexaceae bacterium]|jgi:small subunit ribosomal protein S4|nr:MAG: 30S ribosomal protein S4 [Chloroflexota bacterium]RLT33083.1 MAG: 30S ribosomal protein S4 [Chloroflexota bacterium]